jgi:hypothetical protein
MLMRWLRSLAGVVVQFEIRRASPAAAKNKTQADYIAKVIPPSAIREGIYPHAIFEK